MWPAKSVFPQSWCSESCRYHNQTAQTEASHHPGCANNTHNTSIKPPDFSINATDNQSVQLSTTNQTHIPPKNKIMAWFRLSRRKRKPKTTSPQIPTYDIIGLRAQILGKLSSPAPFSFSSSTSPLIPLHSKPTRLSTSPPRLHNRHSLQQNSPSLARHNLLGCGWK